MKGFKKMAQGIKQAFTASERKRKKHGNAPSLRTGKKRGTADPTLPTAAAPTVTPSAEPASNDLFSLSVTTLELEPGRSSSKQIQLTNLTEKNIAIKIITSDERVSTEPELRLLVDKVPLNIRVRRKPKEGDDVVDETITFMGVVTTETSSEAAFSSNPPDVFKITMNLKSSDIQQTQDDGKTRGTALMAVPIDLSQLVVIDRGNITFTSGATSTRSLKITKHLDSVKSVALRVTASDARFTIEPRFKILQSNQPLTVRIRRKPKQFGDCSVVADDSNDEFITVQAIVAQSSNAEKAFDVEPKESFKKLIACSLFVDLQKGKDKDKNVVLSKRGAKVTKRLCSVDKERLVFTAGETSKNFTIVNPSDAVVHYLFELSSENYRISEEAVALEALKEVELAITVEKRDRKEEKLNIVCVEAKDSNTVDIAQEVRSTPNELRFVKTILLALE